MATEEMKPQTKKSEQKQSTQIKEDLPPPSLPPLPLIPCKSCSLKVSIHCEGCKRKVKKILTSIEGVYKVDIDVKQHKVTVLGIIPPEILLKKLHKAGKNAELIPEIPDPVENKPEPVDPNEKKNKKNKKKKEEKTEIFDGATSSDIVKPEPEKTETGECDKPESEKTDAGECGSGDGGEIAPVKEEKKDVIKKKDSTPADSPAQVNSPAPAEEKKAEETGGANNGKVGKKKKKKGQNLNTTGVPARTQSLPPPTTEDQDRPFNQINDYHISTNNNPPRHDTYPYPAPSYYPYPAPSYYSPQVMYGVSYNVAQPPLSVDAASYYTPPPPYSYAYMHPGYQPSDQNHYPSRPSDSFELVSDENPNGCSVM